MSRLSRRVPPRRICHPAEAAPLGGAAGQVERGEDGAGARDLVGAGPGHVADHEDLVGPEPRDGDLKPGGGAGPPPDAAVDPAEPGIEQVLEVAQGQTGHVDLSHLGDDDEALAGDLEGVGQLHVAGQDQDQHVAGPEAIRGVDRPGDHRLELGADPLEHLQAEDRQRPGGVGRRGPEVGAAGAGPAGHGVGGLHRLVLALEA